MIDAEINVLAALFLFLDEAGCEATAASVDNVAALLSLDRGVQAEVFATGQADASELLLVAELVCAVLHESLELGQGLFDLRHGSGAVDELALFRVVLLVGDDEGQQ